MAREPDKQHGRTGADLLHFIMSGKSTGRCDFTKYEAERFERERKKLTKRKGSEEEKIPVKNRTNAGVKSRR